MVTQDYIIFLQLCCEKERRFCHCFEPTGHLNKDYCVMSCFSTVNGKWVISGSEDNKLYIWDLNTGEAVERFVGHSGPVLSCDSHPSEGIIASGSLDKKIKIWRWTSTCWSTNTCYFMSVEPRTISVHKPTGSPSSQDEGAGVFPSYFEVNAWLLWYKTSMLTSLQELKLLQKLVAARNSAWKTRLFSLFCVLLIRNKQKKYWVKRHRWEKTLIIYWKRRRN